VCALILFLFLVGIADKPSCIVPIGQIHPQQNRFENSIIKMNNAIRNNGKVPSAIEKKIYSIIPAPLERGFLGELKIGSIFTRLSKLFKFTLKINSIAT
jgi:hypothetical protein